MIITTAVLWGSAAAAQTAHRPASINNTPIPVSLSRTYVTVPLPKGVSVQLPKNWIVLGGNTRQTLDAAVEALIGTASEPNSDLPFAANLYSDAGRTIAVFNIRYYPDMDVGQADVLNSTASEIRAFDQELHSALVQSMSGAGMRVLQWMGTRRLATGNKTVLLSEYRRAGRHGASPFRVRLFRVLDGPRSFTITYSYDESVGLLLGPIGDRVLSSIQVSP
jgi:hypothetical protein